LMPRKVKGVRARELEAPAVVRKEAHGSSVALGQVEAAPLVTIHPDSIIWMSVLLDHAHLKLGCQGAFVRLRPPKDLKPGKLEEILRTLKDTTLVVKVELPREDAEVALGKDVAEQAPVVNAAEVVRQMVAEARNVDKGALADLVEKVMMEEGL
jgi:hypothetical protein